MEDAAATDQASTSRQPPCRLHSGWIHENNIKEDIQQEAKTFHRPYVLVTETPCSCKQGKAVVIASGWKFGLDFFLLLTSWKEVSSVSAIASACMETNMDLERTINTVRSRKMKVLHIIA
ncbi:uncharacterized protein PAN0_013c4603 [Moesziomyces antarcticus]|uniref:Uncharacterized protein n=2 Tax=Pseudozyma antarctica TaxID=84753 RepID=A0A081CI85_PSEA2|nr:uncharacterized protein PAN0_013c4603 [Moesziomyces antarcticus]GAK66381.1 hypothetical protein PAN0_013c4603 [Moesziomyces antarcticus]SPO47420.1 uncharacterized protein PSANT_05108 [Moesziomyces antarcticus]